MQQIRGLIALALIMVLISCSNGQVNNTNGIARIRATALAAQHSAAQPAPEEQTPAPVEARPVAIVQPGPGEATANTSAVWSPLPTDAQSLDFITALGVVLLIFALGCAVGSIVTAYMLGQKEAKRG